MNLSGAVLVYLLLAANSEEEFTRVPTPPRNLTVTKAKATSLLLTWLPPEQRNGIINGYRVYYMHANYTEVQSMRTAIPAFPYELGNLKPFTDYKIWVKAFTGKYEGESSLPINYKTDVQGPSAPRIVNLTCQSYDSIHVQWERPSVFFHNVDYYYLMYRNDTTQEYKVITMQTSKEHLDTAMSLPNLTSNTLYEIKVKGASISIYDQDKIMEGNDSTIVRVVMKPNCEKLEYELDTTEEEEEEEDQLFSPALIIGVSCVGSIVVLILLGLVVWRRYFRTSYYYYDVPPRANIPTAVDWDRQADPKTSIPLKEFAMHVADLHADGDIGFSREYEAIQSSSSHDDFTADHSQHPENKMKNRYLNILAYDHTRVQLNEVPGHKKIDYVNANYIDGFQKARAYIGTQGPLPATFDSFWRMVWEQGVVTIVMITNLIERGRRKCDMYWPKEGVETYGVIQVKLIKEVILATYTIRTLEIRHLRQKKKKEIENERLVYQYHYTNWPDHGTPDHPLPVINFVKKSSAANPPDAGPIIVHCSAGVGRTGTYIVLDTMLKQIQFKGEINIFGFLTYIRTQRNFLVQTEEQYIFIHDALVEAIQGGDTNISQAALPEYVQHVQLCDTDGEPNPNNPDQVDILDLQYKLVISFHPKDFNLVSANKPTNACKNRSCIVPIESSRVHLTPKPGVDGSDYINASWFQGFNKLHEFIIAQHPFRHTALDFWQMIWDHNAQTIVLLTCMENPEFGPFWPVENEDMEGESYKVKYVDTNENGDITTKDFVVQSIQDDYELTVRIIMCPGWPSNSIPLSKMFALIDLVQDWHTQYQNGPVVVVDRFGGTEAATFCCLTTVYKQLKFESSADLYMYAKMYHNKRPGIWHTKDHYFMMYKALASLVNEGTPPALLGPAPAPEMYATANGHLNGVAGSSSGCSGPPVGPFDVVAEIP